MFVLAFSAEDDPFKENLNKYFRNYSSTFPADCHPFRLSLAGWPLGVNSVAAHLHKVEVVCNEKTFAAPEVRVHHLRCGGHFTKLWLFIAGVLQLYRPWPRHLNEKHNIVIWRFADPWLIGSLDREAANCFEGRSLTRGRHLCYTDQQTDGISLRCWGDWISQLAKRNKAMSADLSGHWKPPSRFRMKCPSV